MSEQVVTLKEKVIVGVTGNIATGKSAVMRLAAQRGALTIDADDIVHELMDEDPGMQAAVAVAFGPEVRLPDGRINRRALGKIVFNDDIALRDLEQMVHPAVRREVARRIQEAAQGIVFVEAIKLLEGPMAAMCHQVWVTRCPRQRQLERLMICRGMDAETAARRIEVQPPQEEKVAQADVVIDTAGLMRETEAQFELAWSRLPAPQSAPARQLPVAELEPAPATTEPAPTMTEPAPTMTEPAPAMTEPAPAMTEPAPAMADAAPAMADAAPAVDVRRARPSDIPSILLLIHKATDGALRLKRADLLLSLGERSYFIGQVGAEIQAVLGWNIENLVGCIDQLYFHPEEAALPVGGAVLAKIEESAQRHICELIVAFLPSVANPAISGLFDSHGYGPAAVARMPPAWQTAIQESQPENSQPVVKVLRERVTHPL